LIYWIDLKLKVFPDQFYFHFNVEFLNWHSSEFAVALYCISDKTLPYTANNIPELYAPIVYNKFQV
jgi:hypothetical protein